MSISVAGDGDQVYSDHSKDKLVRNNLVLYTHDHPQMGPGGGPQPIYADVCPYATFQLPPPPPPGPVGVVASYGDVRQHTGFVQSGTYQSLDCGQDVYARNNYMETFKLNQTSQHQVTFAFFRLCLFAFLPLPFRPLLISS